MKNDPYKKAGVDIKAGNDLVNKIKGDVAKTFDKNVSELIIEVKSFLLTEILWFGSLPPYKTAGM